jgi:hypothetical protein
MCPSRSENASDPVGQRRFLSGGGGNRTRVRRSLAEGLYMLSRCFEIRPALPPSAGAWGQASPAWISRPTPPGWERFASPLHDALSHPAGENGKDVAVLSSQCQFFVGSCVFPFVLRANGTSACHLRRNHPRRNLSPPYSTVLRAERLSIPQPRWRSLKARSISRSASRRFISSRLSYCFLPRARASSTLALPRRK